jgi:hypothetical protein
MSVSGSSNVGKEEREIKRPKVRLPDLYSGERSKFRDDRVKDWFNTSIQRATGGMVGTREKWDRDKGLITNDLVIDFQ